MPFARTEPLRRELAVALPERPFTLRFWDGTELPATSPDGPVFTVRSPTAVAHLLRAPGQLGLGRAYAAGELEADDLDRVIGLLDSFHAPAIDRATRLRLTLAAARACGLTRPPRIPASELRPRGARHSRARDARAVRHHYDVSNDFFKLFLDSSMTYSCALFSRGATTLEEAQLAKRELVCTKLGLREGERLLDVGCGWGSFVLHAAARHGVSAVGITLSPNQAELARRRVAKAGLEDRVEIRLCDYRDLSGRAASASTRSPRSAWSSTSAPAKSTSTPRSSPACSAPAGGCSTTASRACATATPRRAPSPSATSSPTRPRCTSRASCSRWSAPGSSPRTWRACARTTSTR